MIKFIKNEIFKILIIFVVFFILLFFIINKNQEENIYDVAEEIKSYNTGVIENFDDIESAMGPKEKYELIIKYYKTQIKQKEIKLTTPQNINYNFYPKEIEKVLINSNKISDIGELLFTKLFKKFNLTFDIEFIKENSNLRARYTHNTIKIFNITKLPREESLAIFIHELGHYIDVKYLEKQVIYDISDKFYDISWDDTKTLKNGSDKNDFVSGYAMTNKYEDFAESFTYYILFNDDFRKKTGKSNLLEEKYNFFSNYVFKNDEFKKTNFKYEHDLTDYVRDSTKINFSIKNFLEYLQNGI